MIALLRTNPKLTGNIKLIVDSNGNVTITSIGVNDILSQYNNYSVSNPDSSYEMDVMRIFKDIPLEHLYMVDQLPNSDVYDAEYSYEKTYSMKIDYCDNSYYNEQYKSFAPLLLNDDNLPDYYCIFRRPVSDTTDSVVTMVQSSQLVHTVDIKKSNLGKYLQNLINNPLWNKDSIYVSYENNTIEYTGISIHRGGIITQVESLLPLLEAELPVKAFDEYITNGFERLGLLHHKSINLEFLFDDDINDGNQYQYYGLYLYHTTRSEYDGNTNNNVINAINANNTININGNSDVQYTVAEQLSALPYTNSGYGLLAIDCTKISLMSSIDIIINDKIVDTIKITNITNLAPGDYGYNQWNDEGWLMDYVKYDDNIKITQLRLIKSIEWVLSNIDVYQYHPIIMDSMIYYYHLYDNDGERLSFNSTTIDIPISSSIRFDESEAILSTNTTATHILTESGIQSIEAVIPDVLHNSSNTIIVSRYKPIISNGVILLYNVAKFYYDEYSIAEIHDYDYDYDSRRYCNYYSNEYNKYYNVKSGSLIIGKRYKIYGDNVIIDNNGVSVTDEFIANSSDYRVASGHLHSIIPYEYVDDPEILKFKGFNNTFNVINGDVPLSLRYDSYVNDGNEYSVLKEQYSDQFDKSLTTPYINKWGSNNNDVRDCQYRLNMSTSFGRYYNSPVNKYDVQNPSEYSHEWYYLGCYPVDLPNVGNTKCYFDQVFDLKKHSDNRHDYFMEYFVVNNHNVPYYKSDVTTSIQYKSINFGNQHRYSTIVKSDNGYETMFRGVKLSFNGDNGEDLSGYKFSCILNPYTTITAPDYLNDVSITVSRNIKWKTIVLCIDVIVEDYKVKYGNAVHLDYSYLYMMNSIITINGSEKFYGSDITINYNSNTVIYVSDTVDVDIIRSATIYDYKFNGIKLPLRISNGLSFNESDTLLKYHYKLSHDGRYPHIIGLYDNNIITTMPMSSLQTDNGIVYVLHNVSSDIIEVVGNSIITQPNTITTIDNVIKYNGGINIICNKHPELNGGHAVEDFVNVIDGIIPLNMIKWYTINSGYNHYSDIAKTISFNGLINNINNNHYNDVVIGSSVGVGTTTVRYNDPIEINIDKSIILRSTPMISSDNNNIVMEHYSYDYGTNTTINRYSERFNPMTVKVIDDHDINSFNVYKHNNIDKKSDYNYHDHNNVTKSVINPFSVSHGLYCGSVINNIPPVITVVIPTNVTVNVAEFTNYPADLIRQYYVIKSVNGSYKDMIGDINKVVISSDADNVEIIISIL